MMFFICYLAVADPSPPLFFVIWWRTSPSEKDDGAPSCWLSRGEGGGVLDISLGGKVRRGPLIP